MPGNVEQNKRADVFQIRQRVYYLSFIGLTIQYLLALLLDCSRIGVGGCAYLHPILM